MAEQPQVMGAVAPFAMQLFNLGQGAVTQAIDSLRRSNVSAQDMAKVTDAVAKARAKAVPWLSILGAIVPLVLSILSGQPIDIAKLIEAILALLPKS
jgi:hypothetical protein